jgi:DNA repair exonuclease SbcCD ATPase subunit
MICFENIRWKNFLSTGNQWTEVNITGSKTNLIVGQNGAGKSTILDALTFALFGKPFRKINKPLLVNSINGADCKTEIEFKIGKSDYKIVRGIKPNIFEIYQNGQMLDQSSTTIDYQKQLEQNILKMNYKSFTQIVVLGSSTFVPFMRLPLAQRREIIEDILDIQIFSVMNVKLKEKFKIVSDEVRDIDYKTDIVNEKISLQESFLKSVEEETDNRIKEKQKELKTQLEKKDSLSIQYFSLAEDMGHVAEKISEVAFDKQKVKQLNSLRGKFEGKIEHANKNISFFNGNDTCPTCTQSIEEAIKVNEVSKLNVSVSKMLIGLSELKDQLQLEEERERELITLNSYLQQINTDSFATKKEIQYIEKSLESISVDIEKLKGQKVKKGEAYEKLDSLKKDYENLKRHLTEVKIERDCMSAASMLLKDNGIKTRIIKRYLPTMNKLINQYLQSMDFYVNFTLDENFEETIKSRYRDTFSYESFSEGEKARIDIALLLTWRSIAKLKNSVDTNLLILDEIFDGSLDQNGSSELGWILKKFDDGTNVFVISHKEQLNDKFDRTLTAEKVKNFSVLKETLNELD